MPDREFWRFINTFAPWFSALGSLAAVITALYLAQRDRRLNLSVRAKLQVQFVQGGGPGHGEKIVTINVVNKGRRVATVTAICWQVGVFKKQTYWQGPPYSSALPMKLEDGDEVSYRFPTEDFFPCFFEAVPKSALYRWTRLKAFFMRAIIETSVGKPFSTRITRDLHRELVKWARNRKRLRAWHG